MRPWLGLSMVDTDLLSHHTWAELKISHEDSRVVVKKVMYSDVYFHVCVYSSAYFHLTLLEHVASLFNILVKHINSH